MISGKKAIPLDFNIKNLFSINIGGFEVWITETIVNTWIIMLLLIIFSVVIRIKLRKFKEIPTGFQNAIEAVIETFDDFVRKSAGENLAYLGNWFFMVFSFILISNLSGLVGFRPPTADWTTTFAFALATFVLIQVMGIRYQKWEYIKSFFQPHPVFFPLNIIGELARPISLSFRLFGNVLAGMILMALFYSMTPLFLRFIIPAALHAYFDVFTGVVQTYIFCVLSLTFIGGVTVSAEA